MTASSSGISDDVLASRYADYESAACLLLTDGSNENDVELGILYYSSYLVTLMLVDDL